MQENKEIKEFIKAKITKATAEKPITSTQLIKDVRAEFNFITSSRTIRKMILYWQDKEHLPIISSRKHPYGYHFCRSEAEYDAYELEMRNHSIRQFTTIKMVKMNYFGTNQPSLDLVEA